MEQKVFRNGCSNLILQAVATFDYGIYKEFGMLGHIEQLQCADTLRDAPLLELCSPQILQHETALRIVAGSSL